MNSKQRILTALNNGVPDKVPIFEALIDEPIIIELAKLLGISAQEPNQNKGLLRGEESYEVLDLYCSLIEEMELDGTSSNFSTGLRPINGDRAKDKFGRVYRLSELGDPIVLEGPIQEPSDIKGYDMVSKLEMDDFEKVQYVVEKAGDEKAHFLSIPDPFKTSWLLRGDMQNLLIDYIESPNLVHDLARISTNFAKAVVDMVHKFGVDIVMLEGDLGGEETTFISPKHYRKYVKPYEEEVVDYVHQKGLKIVKHSDGNVYPLLDDFIEVGFDGFHPVQPQCMEILKVKEYLAGEVCVLGNIDCRNLLPYGTKKDVKEVVRKTVEKAAPGGGYIICSSNSIHPDCQAENYITMVNAAHEYGVYDDCKPT